MMIIKIDLCQLFYSVPNPKRTVAIKTTFSYAKMLSLLCFFFLLFIKNIYITIVWLFVLEIYLKKNFFFSFVTSV